MEDNFGKRLQKALDKEGMKQIELAEKTGFSKARVSQWIHNKHIPDADGLYKIAKVLNVSETWLMGENVPMTYDRKELEIKYQVCDLFQKCYGKEAYKAVYDFLQLDEIDRQTIISNIQFLLSAEKYAIKKRIIERIGNIIRVDFKGYHW